MPIWDEFLTERDKKHLETSGRDARGHKTFGLRPALLIIDDYYSVLGTTPQPILESVKTWPMSCGMEGWEAVYKTQELLDSARSADIPIVFATGLGDFPSPWGMRDQGPGRLTAEQKEIAFKIVEELAPRPSELVIKKAAASAFWGTPLVGHLVAKGVDTVIACGLFELEGPVPELHAETFSRAVPHRGADAHLCADHAEERGQSGSPAASTLT
jgi:hypothetical protein